MVGQQKTNDVAFSGPKLRTLRGSRTQRELAEAVGVSISVISDLERGQIRAPNVVLTVRLAGALGVKIEQLMDIPDQPWISTIPGTSPPESHRELISLNVPREYVLIVSAVIRALDLDRGK